MSSYAPSKTLDRPVARRLLLSLVAAAMLVFAPLSIDIGHFGLKIDPSAALAKSGSGKEGDKDDRDDDDDDKDDDRDDDDDDDNSGRGSGNSGRGSSGDRDRDRGRDTGQDRRGGGDDRSGPGRDNDGAAVTRVGLTSSGIVVTYRDGTQEIVEDGRYRRLSSGGRVLETRAATGADLVRLRALAGGKPAAASAAKPSDGPGYPARIRIRGRDIIVEYSNGWTESVDQGRYRLTDRYGHVATNRNATESDRARLMALAGR